MREQLFAAGSDPKGSGEGGGAVEVKRELTSNIKVSRSRITSPSAVDSHTLVFALVRLLAVFNLKRSWGGRLNVTVKICSTHTETQTYCTQPDHSHMKLLVTLMSPNLYFYHL